MKAIGYYQPLPIDNAESLQDIELPEPVAGPRDLLVRVKAVSVNPVDTKVRKNAAPEAGQAKVLGWDAVGTVEAVGSGVKNFKVGDRVYYAGSITRPGANAELHAVDERIAAHRAQEPRRRAGRRAAADHHHRLRTAVRPPARAQGRRRGPDAADHRRRGRRGLHPDPARAPAHAAARVATASRAETREWCLALGAHAVIDHSKPLAAELKAAGIGEVDMVASLTQTEQHYAQIIESLKPQGQLAVIDDMKVLDAMPLKTKSLSLHWEMMFARSRFETPDMAEQGKLLAEVAALVDAGRIRTTANASFGTINAANLQRAHALIESGKAQGKVVLAGF
jgi:NADPH:quinone reductase-like Zn-dependent oxidoreductase